MLSAATAAIHVASTYYRFSFDRISAWTSAGKAVSLDWYSQCSEDVRWHVEWWDGHVSLDRKWSRYDPPVTAIPNPEDSAGFQIIRENRRLASSGDAHWYSGFKFFIQRDAKPEPFWHLNRWEVSIPDMAIIVLFSLPSIFWGAKRWRAIRRTRSGLCACCGYDLRASPDRCPECGAVPSMMVRKDFSKGPT
jgi:hypothetical protein